jgi:diacylglycerol O-acyltransferase / wax synthase
MPYERLSAQDATLFCAEAPAAPLQIGALGLFEAGPLTDQSGCLKLAALRNHIESRLAATPRFRQKLVRVPFDQAKPVWVDDESFDIANHVKAVALRRPGGAAELRAAMADLLAVPLDRNRPLWEVWFIEGIEGDRIAVVPKLNHVMADGMAALEFVLSVLDPEPRAGAGMAPPWTPRPSPGPGRLLLDGVVDQVHRQVGAGCKAITGLILPARLASGIRGLAKAFVSIAVPAPKLPITRPVGLHRDFAWVRLPIGELRDIAHCQQVTLNDVVLAIVGKALGYYLGDGLPGADLRTRVVVPVSTHRGPGEIQNRFSMMVADVPLGSPDPLGRLRATHAEMVACKASGQTEIVPFIFELGDLISPWLLRRVASLVLKRQPFVNLAVTNLPGTDDPLYLLGSRMLDAFPFVTVTGNIALIIGVLSYAGTLGVGITTDADVVTDPERIVQGLELAASELSAANRARSANLSVANSF